MVEARMPVESEADEVAPEPGAVDLTVASRKRDWIGDTIVVLGLAVAANLYLVSALIR